MSDEQTGKQIGDASDCRDVALAREATDAQAEIIEVLLDELRAWRQADARHDLTRNVMGDGHNDDVLRAMAATDAILAKHNNRL